MAVDYVARIRRQDQAGLLGMLQKLANGNTIYGWSSGKAFEHVILQAFALENADVQWPFNVQHEGHTVEQIDGVVYCSDLSFLVEAKDYSVPINVEPIAKMRNQLSRRPPATMGLIFARKGFTSPAKILTRMVSPLSILLWEFEELETAVRDKAMCKALLTKYRYAVELGMPDYDIRGGYR